MTKLHRRTLLRSLGLVGGAYFLPSLRPLKADMTPPKRLLIHYTYHGTLPQFYAPTGLGGVGAASETSFALGALHAPLADYQKKLLVLSGLDMPTHRKDIPAAEACGHWYGAVQSLTGNGQDGTRQQALGPSIDQHVIQGWKAQNQGNHPTRLPGLYAAVSDIHFVHQNPFFSGRSSSVPIDVFPETVFHDRLFPDGTASPDDAAAARLVSQRKLVLDHVYAEYKSVQARVGRLEQQRLDQHATLVRDLQTSLSSESRSCTATGAPSSADRSYGYRAKAVAELVSSAFACDITRVACVLNNGIPDTDTGFTAGEFGQPDLHQLIHSVDRGGSLASVPEAVEYVKRWHLANTETFAGLLKALDGVAEPDGSTLLDNTVVLWAGEIAEGNHGTANMHWLLAGGAGGAIKMGRYLAFGDPLRGESQPDPTAPTTSDLLCSIASALGVPTPSFGLPEACRGPIASVYA